MTAGQELTTSCLVLTFPSACAMSITVASVLVDGDRAAVELRRTGVSKLSAALDEQRVWIVKVEGGLITEGKSR